jgi:hypothetical protein
MIKYNLTEPSIEIRLGKAGEHFVCFDLLMQGYSAFLADKDSAYDIVVEVENTLKRIQVKTTASIKNYSHAKNMYRYGTRRAKGVRKRFDIDEVDVFAFVAMDIQKICYISIKEMISASGGIKQLMCFKREQFNINNRLICAL